MINQVFNALTVYSPLHMRIVTWCQVHPMTFVFNGFRYPIYICAREFSAFGFVKKVFIYIIDFFPRWKGVVWLILSGATGLHLTSSSPSSNVILKRGFDNVRRMASHPHLPYYLSGGADGSVHVWEWGHHRALATPRPGGSFPKVTRLRFNAQGKSYSV